MQYKSAYDDVMEQMRIKFRHAMEGVDPWYRYCECRAKKKCPREYDYKNSLDEFDEYDYEELITYVLLKYMLRNKRIECNKSKSMKK
jgi:hypothetical protein